MVPSVFFHWSYSVSVYPVFFHSSLLFIPSALCLNGKAWLNGPRKYMIELKRRKGLWGQLMCTSWCSLIERFACSAGGGDIKGPKLISTSSPTHIHSLHQVYLFTFFTLLFLFVFCGNVNAFILCLACTIWLRWPGEPLIWKWLLLLFSGQVYQSQSLETLI